MAEEYGTIGIVPKGEWSATTQYDLLNLVEHDGSSYLAKKKPPLGTIPTNETYWQASALGASKATDSSLGIVKGSAGINVGEDGAIDLNTQFEQVAQLANIIAGEAISAVLGKVSKSIATTMNLDQNALLKSMLTSQNVNDANKIPTSMVTYAMQQLITKNTGDITRLNSDFKIGTMLKTMSFGYDGSTAFWVDFNIDGSKIDRIIFDNTEIRQAFTVDGGTTWTIIWSK